jgi:DNA-binding protein
MNPYLIIAGLIAILAAGAGGFKLGSDHEVAAQAREQNHIAEAVDAANSVAAEAIAKIKVTNKTIQNEVRHETETNTVYRDCKLTPNGLLLANQALAGAKATGDSELPKVDTTGK